MALKIYAMILALVTTLLMVSFAINWRLEDHSNVLVIGGCVFVFGYGATVITWVAAGIQKKPLT